MGIKAFDAVIMAIFLLHAYLILVFGDIPTIALMMHMKGENGISPCWICDIKGISFIFCTYYVPLPYEKIPGAMPCRYNLSNLSIYIHEKLLEKACNVKMAPDNKTCETLAKKHGINSVSVVFKFHLLNFFSFLAPIQFHISYLKEFNSKSHWILDWQLQRLGSSGQRLCYQILCLGGNWSYYYSMQCNDSNGL